jgi:hypothetical protein
LLPLAGPEEFDDKIMDKLPDDLQYLPPDKERECDPDIRIMFIETIMLLWYKFYKLKWEYLVNKISFIF